MLLNTRNNTRKMHKNQLYVRISSRHSFDTTIIRYNKIFFQYFRFFILFRDAQYLALFWNLLLLEQSSSELHKIVRENSKFETFFSAFLPCENDKFVVIFFLCSYRIVFTRDTEPLSICRVAKRTMWQKLNGEKWKHTKELIGWQTSLEL